LASVCQWTTRRSAPTTYAVPGNLQAVGFGLPQLAGQHAAALTRSLGEYDVYDHNVRRPSRSRWHARPGPRPPGTRSAPRSCCPPRTTTRVIVDRHGTIGLALHTAPANVFAWLSTPGRTDSC
jgi:hypothetical protein